MDEFKINNMLNSWKAKGFNCKTWISPSGQIWSDPGHDADEVLILLEGEIEVFMQGKTYRPQIGEEIVIPAKQPHTVINPGQTANRIYWLHAYFWEDTSISNSI